MWCRSLNILIFAVCCGNILAADVSAAADRHVDAPDPGWKIVIEHAQLRVDGGGNYAAFLTIWNGTSKARVIASVTIDSFNGLAIARSTAAGLKTQPISDALLSIPPRSELHMDTDTMFVVTARKAILQPTSVVVELDDGTKLQSPVALLGAGEKVPDHRHD